MKNQILKNDQRYATCPFKHKWQIKYKLIKYMPMKRPGRRYAPRIRHEIIPEHCPICGHRACIIEK